MVDATNEAGIGEAPAPQTHSQDGQYESDFSPRKMRVALVILLGQTFATSMLPFIALPLLLVPMTTQFGWSATEFSFATTSLMVVGACSVFFLGYAVDRVGCRPIIIIGTLMVGVVTMALSQVHSLVTFCIGFAALGFFGSTGMPYSKITAALFTKHRGKALAILGAESAVAFAIAPQIIRFLLENYGWQQMFLVLGVIIIAVVPLLYFFLEEPGTAGGSRNLFKYMKQKKAEAAASAEAKATGHEPPPTDLEGMSLKQIFKDRVFWLILIAGIISAAPRGGLFTYLSPILSHRGFDGQAATANFLSLITLAGAGGAVLGGLALDRFHSTKLAVPFKLMSMLALILLGVVTASFGGMTMLVAIGILWGLSDGAMRPMATYFNTRLFGLKAFGGMSGLNAFFLAMFLGIIAPIVGFSHDMLGSYEPALWILTIALFAGAVIYLVLGPYRYSVMIGATPAQKKEEETQSAPAMRV